MKSVIILFVLLSTYCYGDSLLGGWSTSTDEGLKQACLKKALTNIHGTQVGDDVQSQVSNYICKTQIVNGLNIKCSFTLREQNWQCSYYKSFIQGLDIQLDQCERIEEENDDEQGIDQLAASDDDKNEEQRAVVNENEEEEEEEQVAKKSSPSGENEEDDEAEIDALNKRNSEHNVNNEEEEEQ